MHPQNVGSVAASVRPCIGVRSPWVDHLVAAVSSHQPDRAWFCQVAVIRPFGRCRMSALARYVSCHELSVWWSVVGNIAMWIQKFSQPSAFVSHTNRSIVQCFNTSDIINKTVNEFSTLSKIVFNYSHRIRNSIREKQLQLHTHTHTTILLLFWNLSRTTRVSRYQKGKPGRLKPIWIYWSKR